jgi:hypothetical protein
MDISADIVDVQEMTNRVMINLFKQKIQETDIHRERLEGTWDEASHILKNHFGKISRIMSQNQYNLHNLYRAAIRELELI